MFMDVLFKHVMSPDCYILYIIVIDSLQLVTLSYVFSQRQGYVIIEPNLWIFRLIAGYGYLFFGLCPT
jgi:hypothetical protein